MPLISGGGGGGLPLTGGTLTGPLTLNLPHSAVSQSDALTMQGTDGVFFYTATDGGTEIDLLTNGAKLIVNDDAGHAIFQALGSSLVEIPSDGTFLILRVAAPTDGSIPNSSMNLWLDDTPAATKLMVKAKDSGGTVKTAAIALT